MAQVPRADAGRICPFHNKDMALVCHTCPLWIQLRGKHPNTGEDVDDWGCAFAWMPMLLIENAKQIRSNAAATESFRNDVTAIGTAMVKTAQLRALNKD
jgi:hypothetical protein